MVLLKVSPWNGVLRFEKRRKLSPRYIGPFKVLARIGPVAYTFEFPEELKGIHNTFHVLNLKKCLAEGEVVRRLNQIADTYSRSRWNSQRRSQVYFECEDQIKKKYHHLFTSNQRLKATMAVDVSLSHPSQHYGVTWTLDYTVTSFKLARWKVRVNSLWHKPLKGYAITYSKSINRGLIQAIQHQPFHHSSKKRPRLRYLKEFHQKLWFHWIYFDYRVPLGFDSIAGGLDHVNPVIRLPIEHEISRGTRVGTKHEECVKIKETALFQQCKGHVDDFDWRIGNLAAGIFYAYEEGSGAMIGFIMKQSSNVEMTIVPLDLYLLLAGHWNGQEYPSPLFLAIKGCILQALFFH
ncbi:hypothetical protein Tco_0678774 [Tanacetum coccineum]|uniref:Tf2-1-like SH3-like domain-containing protein n=1 Tax=Tanacetum coccineum TaxID=301880 RepID=A0ABQ4XH85_9ASTR